MPAAPPAADLESVFDEHRSFLWGVGYRMTGSAADADDVVQDTFVRALERGPADRSRPWRPWLVRVAVNLARDLLRRRRRRRYEGPWLPSPVPTERLLESAGGDADPASRSQLLESASYAFLLALEALTPNQRAVLVLRDVLDYSVAETAEALSLGTSSVKTTLHRARRALDRAAERPRIRLDAATAARTQDALGRFLTALAASDVAAIEALLRDDVRETSDGGSEFVAAKVPVVGREKVARFFVNIARMEAGVPAVSFVSLNGLPALIVTIEGDRERYARRFVVRLELDEDGRIAELHSILATEKLTAVFPADGGG